MGQRQLVSLFCLIRRVRSLSRSLKRSRNRECSLGVAKVLMFRPRKFGRSLGPIASSILQKVAFGVGLLFPIVVFGLIASIGQANFLIVVADLLFVLFSRRLWRKWHLWTLLHRSAIQTRLPGFGESPAPLFP